MHNSRRWLLCIVATLIATIGLTLPNAPARADDDDYVPGEVVVKLVSAASLPGVASTHRLDPIPLDQFGSRPIFRLKILDRTRPDDKAEELEDDKARVEYAEPNYYAQAPEGRQKSSWAIGGSATEYATQWAPTTIGLPAAQSVTLGQGTSIAVLDTGIDLDHPALRDKLVAGYDFVDDDTDPREEGVYNPDDPANIAFGHGTHVAGLIALVAPQATIMPIRVLEPDGTGNVWVLSEGLEYALRQGAHVINLSLGTLQRTEILDELLDELGCSDEEPCTSPNGWGVVVVAAAGNGGDTDHEYPAAENLHELLAVGATTQNDALAPFSARGSWVHIAAPGELIVSTVPGGGYGTWSGTSMAAPLATGTAALLHAACSMLDAETVVEQIIETAVPIPGDVPLRLDAGSAVEAACSRTFVPLIRRAGA